MAPYPTLQSIFPLRGLFFPKAKTFSVHFSKRRPNCAQRSGVCQYSIKNICDPAANDEAVPRIVSPALTPLNPNSPTKSSLVPKSSKVFRCCPPIPFHSLPTPPPPARSRFRFGNSPTTTIIIFWELTPQLLPEIHPACLRKLWDFSEDPCVPPAPGEPHAPPRPQLTPPPHPKPLAAAPRRRSTGSTSTSASPSPASSSPGCGGGPSWQRHETGGG